MADYSKKKQNDFREKDEIVSTLLRLPSKNLEARIKELEQEIQERQKMRNHILSKLGTHRIRLENHKKHLKYISLIGQSPAVLHSIAGDLLKIETSMAGELKDGFRDISRLKERLQEAREELETERQKLAMISDSNEIIRNRRPPQKT